MDRGAEMLKPKKPVYNIMETFKSVEKINWLGKTDKYKISYEDFVKGIHLGNGDPENTQHQILDVKTSEINQYGEVFVTVTFKKEGTHTIYNKEFSNSSFKQYLVFTENGEDPSDYL